MNYFFEVPSPQIIKRSATVSILINVPLQEAFAAGHALFEASIPLNVSKEKDVNKFMIIFFFTLHSSHLLHAITRSNIKGKCPLPRRKNVNLLTSRNKKTGPLDSVPLRFSR
jgi:hypothetical protein